MNTQLENNYPHAMDFALQLTIGSGFLGLKDFGRLGKVDKFLNSLCENNIEKYYEILEKCSSTPFIKETKFNPWNNNDFPNEFNTGIVYKYNNTWDDIFGKKLNKDEMAFYYTYFIFRFHKFYRIDSYSKFWSCILYENGYIKSFSESYYNGTDEIDDTDIILKINIHYSYLIYRNYPKKLNYWGTKIKFQNKGKDIIIYQRYPKYSYENKEKYLDREIVNLKLLDALITNEKYMSMVSKKFM